ncbi:hypothetical protein [Thermus tengchongensis]|uniref:Uncharacterized protein n=1 Tax=Thermus tengchongensis TaxID=1214928 RepID=A0A4Y9F8X9_9DEIN|nr:hypothetical protein [Thermus tengchongensis]TFU25627.1 hypothetical protein E0687_09995 [Thermus tengchongensis]
MVVVWCPVSQMWEAVVLQEGRMAGYGWGRTRALAVERAVQEAIRRGYRVPLQTYLAWAGAALSDALDHVLAAIRGLER